MLYRILHDRPARTSTRSYSQTPETERLEGTTTQTVLNSAWQKYAIDLNRLDYSTPYGSHKGNNKAVKLLTNGSGGICNGGWPKLMNIAMGGEVLDGSIIFDNGIQNLTVTHLDYYEGPPSIQDVNYFTHPELIFKWVNVGWEKKTRRTYWVNPSAPIGGAYDTYWPNVSDHTLTIPLSKLESFPRIPQGGYYIRVKVPLHLRTLPYGPITGDLLFPGIGLLITAYKAHGSDVWGQTSGGAWVPLEGSDAGGGPVYFTDWRMITPPPQYAPIKIYQS